MTTTTRKTSKSAPKVPAQRKPKAAPKVPAQRKGEPKAEPKRRGRPAVDRSGLLGGFVKTHKDSAYKKVGVWELDSGKFGIFVDGGEEPVRTGVVLAKVLRRADREVHPRTDRQGNLLTLTGR